MSVFLKDRVWIMLSEISKRGVYPLHGYKLGIFRLPVNLTEESTINNIFNELKKTGFKLDRYADRIYVTYTWKEQETDTLLSKILSIPLDITIEIVTGEVIDLIYQIKPIEKFGDTYRIKNYRQRADLNAKMVIDTILRNTSIGDKLISYYQKTEKLSLENAIDKLTQLTPLAVNPITRNVNPPPPPASASITSQEISSTSVGSSRSAPNIPNTPSAGTMTSGTSDTSSISLTGSGTDYSKVEGPIDTSFKSKRQKVGKFKGINVWGPVDPPGQLGIWGDSVCVDFDICIGDGACIEACPVNVYEWLETPGHPGSEKKPFMAREKDCIFCLACENVCPPQAIKIYEK
jgi:NAD-dependent dihydropyrimidine dehydrogenase PreA subunit